MYRVYIHKCMRICVLESEAGAARSEDEVYVAVFGSPGHDLVLYSFYIIKV